MIFYLVDCVNSFTQQYIKISLKEKFKTIHLFFEKKKHWFLTIF